MRKWVFLLVMGWFTSVSYGQINPELMQAIASHYYKNERPVVKGRWYHLYLFDTISVLPLPIAESLLSEHPDRIKQLRAANLQAKDARTWDQLLEAFPEGLRKKMGTPHSLEQFHAMLEQRTTQHPYLLVVFTPYRVSENEYIAIVRHFRNSEHQKEEVAVWKRQNGQWRYAEQLYFYKP